MDERSNKTALSLQLTQEKQQQKGQLEKYTACSKAISLTQEQKTKALETLMRWYNVGNYQQICEPPLAAVSQPKARTIGEITNALGSKATRLILIPLITELSQFCCKRDVMDENMIIACADAIVSSQKDLTIPEVMLFFHRFKSGVFGNIYGAITPLDITSNLYKFRDTIFSLREMKEMQDKQRRAKENRDGAVTYEEYIKLSQK